MLTLIKTEIAYSRYLRFVLFPVFGLFIYKVLSGTEAINTILFILTFSLISSIYGTWIKEKRERLFMQLPFSPQMVAIVRVILVTVPFILIYLLLFFINPNYYNGTEWYESPSELYMLFGFSIFGSAVYLMIYDQIAGMEKEGRIVLGTLITIIAMILIIIFAVFIEKSYQQSALTANLISTLVLAGAIFMLFKTITTFVKRDTYLKS